MIRLHLHSGFSNPKLHIKPDMELGHLYDDRGDEQAMAQAVTKVGLAPGYIQRDHGFAHFDLWAKPLEKAKTLFRITGDREFAKDVERLSKEGAHG